jgi:hypothetical protein
MFGVLAGVFRYWFGFFILGQGIFVGWLAPKLVAALASVNASNDSGSASLKSFVFIIIILFFLFGQAIGFGLAQPWFEPIAWLDRVLSGRTSEYLFGIRLFGGVVNQPASLVVDGGFWLFFNLFDLIFMAFFLLIGFNAQQGDKS